MKYTRYDYNKKEKSSFAVSLIIVIILGTLLGAGIFKISGNTFNNFVDNNDKSQVGGGGNTKTKESKLDENYVAIQCGVYQNIDNANKVVSSIPPTFHPFIIEDEGKYRIIAGIFQSSEVDSRVSELNSISINNYSIKYEINDNDNNRIISEMINGYLQIINKVSEDEVESVNTSEFKEWIKGFSKDNSNDTVNEILKMTNELPEEYKKENNVEVLKTLYNLLSKYKV